MRWNPKRIPVSGWYVKAILAGIGLLALLFVASLPVGHGTRFEPFLFAVHIVDGEGDPVAGIPVFESQYGAPDPKWDYFGKTGQDGYVFGVLPMMSCETITLVGLSFRGSRPRDVEFFIRDGGDWRTLGSIEGVPVPESTAKSWSRSKMHDPSQRQIPSFPIWASDVNILHATIER